MKTYDLIVIGAGPGGYETAAEAARMGQRTLLIERDQLGGTCLNRGCIPTKALCRSAEVAMTVGNAADFGVSVSDFRFDFSRAAERKDRVIEQLREGVAIALRDVDVINAEARFAGLTTIEADGETYVAGRVILASGSRPATLDIPGAELTVNSDQLLSMTSLPESAAIIGGGVIGLEFASILAAFGVKVTVIEYCKEILPGFDSEIAKRLRSALKRRGISFATGAAVTEVSHIDGKLLRVAYTEKDKSKSTEAEMVLMAVGRRPVIPEGLKGLGIKLDRGFVATDEQMQTSLPGLYAIGDVNGRCLLAHAASAQGRTALGLSPLPTNIPAAVFTLPEAGSVGLTAEQCAARGIDVAEGKAIYRANGKALAMDETDGMVKIIVDKASLKILGCHVCGAHAADIVQEVSIAMDAGMTANRLLSTVHIHPTLGELIIRALSSIDI